jgi:hypothetical protein
MKNIFGVNMSGKNIKIQGDPLEDFVRALDTNGLPKVLPAREYLKFGNNNLSFFMISTSTYVLPTEELLETLDDIIEPESNAIEICSGNGVIGRELNMPLTDSKIQIKDPEIRSQYLLSGNPPITYPEDVEELEALEAVEKYKPDTVLACFGTHRWKPGMRSGFMYGVDYEELWKKVQRIILVGNDKIHKENPLMKRRHREIQKWGIISRTQGVPTKVYIWEK